MNIVSDKKTDGTQALQGKEITLRFQMLIILKFSSTTNFQQVSSQEITGIEQELDVSFTKAPLKTPVSSH